MEPYGSIAWKRQEMRYIRDDIRAQSDLVRQIQKLPNVPIENVIHERQLLWELWRKLDRFRRGIYS